MSKGYTEEQYKQYSKFMEDSANTDNIVEGVNIYMVLKDWIKDNNISEESIDEMNKRIDDETEKLMKQLMEDK